MNTEQKEAALLALAHKRQNTRYEGHTCIGDYDKGIWECDHVSPFSLSAHNANADVMIILQDWCSSDSFDLPVCEETLKLGHTPSVKTNIYLKDLLKRHLGLTLADTYATNLFPFVKPGAMNAPIPAQDLLKAANEFTLPMIDIIQPKIAVCLGLETYNAIRKALGYTKLPNLAAAIAEPIEYQETRICCQAHTGQLGRNNRNRDGVDRVNADWETLALGLSPNI